MAAEKDSTWSIVCGVALASGLVSFLIGSLLMPSAAGRWIGLYGDVAFPAGLLGLLVPLWWGAARGDRKERDEPDLDSGGTIELRALARALDLEDVEVMSDDQVRGRAGTAGVELTRRGASVEVLVHDSIDSALRLGPPQRDARATRTGDGAFDAAVTVRGGAKALSLLDAKTRALALRVVEARGTVEDAFATIVSRSRSEMRDLIRLARELGGDKNVAEGLRVNVEKDPLAGVRLTSLAAALERDPASERTASAIHSALVDADQGVRLLAALASPQKRSAALAMTEPALMLKILEAMPLAGWAFTLRTLGDCGAEAEPHLLASLAAPAVLADATLAEAALDAIGRAGTPAAVASLHQIAHPHAERAIREIQVRAGGMAGDVSLAAPEGAEGALSVTEEEGALSLAHAKKQTT